MLKLDFFYSFEISLNINSKFQNNNIQLWIQILQICNICMIYLFEIKTKLLLLFSLCLLLHFNNENVSRWYLLFAVVEIFSSANNCFFYSTCRVLYRKRHTKVRHLYEACRLFCLTKTFFIQICKRKQSSMLTDKFLVFPVFQFN